jgi:hypothetical protein
MDIFGEGTGQKTLLFALSPKNEISDFVDIVVKRTGLSFFWLKAGYYSEARKKSTWPSICPSFFHRHTKRHTPAFGLRKLVKNIHNVQIFFKKRSENVKFRFIVILMHNPPIFFFCSRIIANCFFYINSEKKQKKKFNFSYISHLIKYVDFWY